MQKAICFIVFIILLPLFFLISILIYLEDGLPVLFKQKRPGKDNILFDFYKFRTMKKSTPEVATHLLENPERYLLNTGKVLRKLSLDELPNFLNIIKGEIKLVGPRPALYNQYDLIEMRTRLGIQKLKPGITGWAQINGRDEISLEKKVELDYWYLQNRNLLLDIKILMLTIMKALFGYNVTH